MCVCVCVHVNVEACFNAMQPMEVKLPSGAPLSVIFLDTEGKRNDFEREEGPENTIMFVGYR